MKKDFYRSLYKSFPFFLGENFSFYKKFPQTASAGIFYLHDE